MEQLIKVLELNQFGNTNHDFYVNTLKDHLATSHLHIEKAHKHNFYATFIFTHGTGTHVIDFNSYEVKTGMVFLLYPGQAHSWELSADCEGLVFFHSREFYETHYINESLGDYQFFSSILGQAAIFLDQEKQFEIVPLFKKVLSASTTDRPKQKLLIICIVTQIYIALERTMLSHDDNAASINHVYYQKFLQFQKLVEQRFYKTKSANEFAKLLNITSKHLNRINKLIVNKTTSEIITDRVILEAKRMLIHAKNNFSQVADELGYEEYSHFSKLFKNRTGLTPSEFSKQHI